MALIPDWPVVRKQLIADLADTFYEGYGVGTLVALDLAETALALTEARLTPVIEARMHELSEMQKTVREIILNITED